MNHRQTQIAQLVTERGRISVSELAKRVGVSEVTLRQDLNALERMGALKRIHGYAVAPDSEDIHARMRTRFSIKQALAEFAASQILPGETIFIEGGSTNALLAGKLASRKDLTIITVSHAIAHLLREAECEVIILGGQYLKSSESMVGPLTRYCIEQLNFHKAFIGVDGWHSRTGFTGRNMLRCEVVNAAMAKCSQAIALTDSSKFGEIHAYPLSAEHRFHRVITDEGVDEATRRQLRLDKIQLDVVPVVQPDGHHNQAFEKTSC